MANAVILYYSNYKLLSLIFSDAFKKQLRAYNFQIKKAIVPCRSDPLEETRKPARDGPCIAVLHTVLDNVCTICNKILPTSANCEAG